MNPSSLMIGEPQPPSTPPLDGFVEECRYIFLTIAMRSTQDHDAILNGQSVQMIQHHMIWLRQESGFTLEKSMETLFLAKELSYVCVCVCLPTMEYPC